MDELIAISFEKCPKHKDEYLSIKGLIIKCPRFPEGIGTSFFNYCKKENKYYNGKEFISAEEAALEYINKNYHKNYKSSEIEVMTQEEFAKELKRKFKLLKSSKENKKSKTTFF